MNAIVKPSVVNIQSRSHRRLAKFVDWIKPDGEKREEIQKQAGDIRSAIGGQANRDGITVVATPEAGSFAKHTGLRRHTRGNYEIEGQDVDLPFVVKPLTADNERIDELLQRFEKYAKASYPATKREITNSSVELEFVTNRLYYDLVPMLASSAAGFQVILKRDGSRRTTSVAKHTEFVRSRTRSSDQLPGRVKFNECVRLLKWWRYERIKSSGSISEVRTTLIELLCASAYDRLSVDETYTITLHKWFSWLASVTAQRTTISFKDFTSVEAQQKQIPGNQSWRVIDPVNANNNVVHSDWGNIELEEFAAWFSDARDAFNRIIAYERAGNDGIVDDILTELFGTAVIDHGELS